MSSAPLRLSLCLLTWNEIDGCKSDVPRLKLDDCEEVYAIDGGSTDGTAEYLTSRGITVYQQDARGYNAAYISAFRRCTTDAVIMFHPKGSIDPAVASNFRHYFEQGYDLVVASRLIPGSVNEEDGQLLRPRKWFVWWLAALTAVLWKRNSRMVWDVLHGCRGMRKAAFDAIDPLKRGLSIDLEMVARSYKRGFRAVEFPVAEKPRPANETHFKAWPTGKALLAYLAFELRRKD